MKFNPPAFVVCVLTIGVGVGGEIFGWNKATALGLQIIGTVALLTVVYYQTRRLD